MVIFPFDPSGSKVLHVRWVPRHVLCKVVNLPRDITRSFISPLVCLHLLPVPLQVIPVPSMGLFLRTRLVDISSSLSFPFILTFLVTPWEKDIIFEEVVIIAVLRFRVDRTRLLVRTIL